MEPHDRILRHNEVLALSGLSASTLKRLEEQDRFPRRRRIGRSAIGWRLSEVQAWIASTPVVEPTQDSGA